MGSADRVVVVAEIREQDHSILKGLGCAVRTDRSWTLGTCSSAGFADLSASCGFAVDAEAQVHQMALGADEQPGSLAQYFLLIGDQLSRRLQQLTESGAAAGPVVLNLMTLLPSSSRLDRIVDGLFPSTPRAFGLPPLLLLNRNVDLLLRSSSLQRALDEGRVPEGCVAVDARGFAARFHTASRVEQFEVERGPFRAILSPSPEKLYRSLVFGTNTYIGHYKLPDSHVRTHYDLREFIQRDDTWEYCYSHLLDLIGDAERALCIGVPNEIQ